VSSLAALGADLDDDLVAALEPTDTTSSLVTYKRIGARCPRVGFDVVDLVSGQRFPGGCHTYECGFCGPRVAWGWGQLAAASRPERLLTLTQAPGDWSTCREAVKNLMHALRRRGLRCWLFWAVEPNPRRTGNHIHALQHGDYIPQALLQRLWGHVVHIEAVKTEQEQQGRTAFYVIKGAASAHYVTKGTAADLPRHLERNGWRAAHVSRGYLRLDNGDPATARALRLATRRGAAVGQFALTTPKESTEDALRRIQRARDERERYLRLFAPTEEVS
jgi:hypothetical protein